MTAGEWTVARVTAETPELVREVRALFEEYHEWLGEVVCSQRLAEEIASLPGPYSPPEGRLLIARTGQGDAVGVVGIRPFEPGSCEMKRLYVRPSQRGAGLGRRLVEEAVTAAREMGYGEVRLTSLPGVMESALAIYRGMGFVDTEPFTDHSHVEQGVDIRFMKLDLTL